MNRKITREIFLYVLFGTLTTVINVLAYSFFYYALQVSNTISTILSWVLSVMFAYVTNRIWVFESENKGAIKEAIEFFACRIATGVLDILIMYIGVEMFKFEGAVVKMLSNILVIVLNYLASKLFIFKNESKKS